MINAHRYSEWIGDAQKRLGRPVSHDEFREAFDKAFQNLGASLMDMVRPGFGDELKAETKA